jgi:hypothetical protein
MKNSSSKFLAATCAALLVAFGGVSFAQTSVTTSTTTSDGTISEFSPDTIVIRSESSPAPVRYSYSKTTTYVDETGAPVSMEMVKSGLPVTVHYVKEGDRMLANRVVVHKRTTTTSSGGASERSSSTTTSGGAAVERSTTTTTAPAAPVIEEKKSSTTTTTTK